MEKIMNKLISEDTYLVFVSILLIVLSLGGMIHYQNKYKRSEGIIKAVIQESVKEGVNKDSLKKAVYNCDKSK
jgi:hypothetical protein